MAQPRVLEREHPRILEIVDGIPIGLVPRGARARVCFDAGDDMRVTMGLCVR